MVEDAIAKTWKGGSGLVQELGSLPIFVLIAATVGAAWYVFQLESDLNSTAKKVLTLEAEIEVLLSRDTEREQLKWQIELLQKEFTRFEVRIEQLQDQGRTFQSDLRDIKRDLERENK